MSRKVNPSALRVALLPHRLQRSEAHRSSDISPAAIVLAGATSRSQAKRSASPRNMFSSSELLLECLGLWVQRPIRVPGAAELARDGHDSQWWAQPRKRACVHPSYA